MSRFTIAVSSNRWTGQSIYEALQNGQMIINSSGYGVPDTLIRMDVSGMVQTDGYFTQQYDTTNPSVQGLVPNSTYNGYGQRFPLLQREFNSKYIWFMLNNNIGNHGMYKASYIYLQNSNGRFAKIDGENIGMIGQGIYNPGKSGPERYVAGQISGNDYGYWRGRSDLNMRLVMRMEDDTIDDVQLDDSSFRMIQGDVLYYDNIFATEQNQMPDKFWIDLKPYDPGPAVACLYPGSNTYTMRTVTSLQLIYSGIKVFTSREEGDNWLMNITPTSEDTLIIDNELSTILAMGKTTMNNFANDVLYNSTPADVQDIVDKLTFYGQNPIDFVTDIYFCPIDVISNGFSPDADIRNTLHFQNTSIQIGSFYKLNKMRTKSLGSIDLKSTNTSITTEIKNNWQDYLEYGLYIYLPYAGIYSLNVEKYMHKSVALKCMFDFRMGALKYYVFADNKLEDMFEGCVRMSMPISGNNKSAAADRLRSSIAQTVGGGAAIVGGLATGNLVAAGAGIVAGANGIAQFNAPTPMVTTGSFNGSSNLFDQTQPKLMLVHQAYMYEDALKNNLGRPDNEYRVGLTGITGYIEMTDVKLTSTQTAVRQEMLKQCLAEGCIL